MLVPSKTTLAIIVLSVSVILFALWWDLSGNDDSRPLLPEGTVLNSEWQKASITFFNQNNSSTSKNFMVFAGRKPDLPKTTSLFVVSPLQGIYSRTSSGGISDIAELKTQITDPVPPLFLTSTITHEVKVFSFDYSVTPEKFYEVPDNHKGFLETRVKATYLKITSSDGTNRYMWQAEPEMRFTTVPITPEDHLDDIPE